MKQIVLRTLKWLGLALGAAVIALAAYVFLTWDRTWDAPLPDLHASADPAAIARGEYLVFGPAHCVECHTESNEAYERYAQTGERPPLMGGVKFPAPPLGAIYSKNITPDRETGIGRYSDPQIARMLRYAVRPDGKASIRPLMPFGDLSDEDVVGILSYLRAQPPVRHDVPDADWTLIGKVIKSLVVVFKPRTEVKAMKTAPAQQPTRERGEYLARGVADCTGCHSPLNQLTFALDGPEFSGGVPMEPRDIAGVDKSVWFAPPNLTPLKGSALNRFPDRETFVARFQRGGRKYAGSPMPWECFGKMTAEDAGALYEFLHSMPAAGQPAPEEPTIKQAN
jgi:mono/diheme cytochrome c family protein